MRLGSSLALAAQPSDAARSRSNRCECTQQHRVVTVHSEAQREAALATEPTQMDTPTTDAAGAVVGRAPWVVIDTETTGLSHEDRILEIAALVVDPESMQVLDSFVTLLQPDRDTGATNIHGIFPEMVEQAPRFSEIAPAFARFLAGRVLVAHNLKFDQGFLEREFALAGLRMEFGRGFCTWSQGTKMTLAKSCAEFDITLEGAHRALADAEATRQLLTFLEQRLTADVAPVQVLEHALF